MFRVRNSYRCICQEGDNGKFCENQTCNLGRRLCSNNGNCYIVSGKRKCQCDFKYTGDQCQEFEDPCKKKNCLSGLCLRTGDGTSSLCQGFPISPFSTTSSRLRSTITNSLETTSKSSPHLNSPPISHTCPDKKCAAGICQAENVSSYIGNKCNCFTGWTGKFCSNRVDVCHSNPCLNGGICLQGSSLDYFCKCLEGYAGYNCQIYLNSDLNEEECLAESCSGNGHCFIDFYKEPHCKCYHGYYGKRCDRIVTCNEMTCKKGLCYQPKKKNVMLPAECLCFDGWTGEYCQIMATTCLKVSFYFPLVQFSN